MTKRKRLPNHMKWARDDCADNVGQAQAKADRLYRRIVDGKYTRHGTEREILEIVNLLLRAKLALKELGAEVE